MSDDVRSGSARTVRQLTLEEDTRYRDIRAIAYNRAPELAAALYTVVPVHWSKNTWAMDAKGRVYINYTGKWTSTWTNEQCAYVLLHEVWHMLRRHAARREAYYKANPGYIFPWNECADLEINDDILAMPNSDLPKGVLYPHEKGLPEGLTAEQYLDMLPRSDDPGSCSGDGDGDGDSEGGDGQGGGSGDDGDDSDNNSGGGGSDEEGSVAGGCADVSDSDSAEADDVSPGLGDTVQDFAEKKTAEAIRDAVSSGAKTAGNYSKEQQEWAESVLKPPVIPWWEKLRRPLVSQITSVRGSGKYTYSQPNRRFTDTEFCIPGKRKVDPRVLIGLDTSGSMLDGSLDMAINEATHILRSRSVRKLQVMNITTVINNLETRRGRSLGDIGEGGGTDMRVAYRAVNELTGRDRPTNFILLTDGETPWPDESDTVPGVHCLAGIITTDERYEELASRLPSWIIPVHIPLKVD